MTSTKPKPKPKVSRGIRNNNPGNIEKGKDKWQGLAAKQTDKRFATFTDPTYGIRALARILIKYQDTYKKDTVYKIISRWAPPVENDTRAYAEAVATAMGIDMNDKIDVHEYDTLEPMVRAIIKHENGIQPYTDSQITKGLVLAGVEPKKKELAQSKTIKAAQVAGAATVVTPVIDMVAKANDSVNQLEPVITFAQRFAEYSPYIFGAIALVAVGYIIYLRIDDRRKGIR